MTLISIYATKTGIEAMRITESNGRFSWIGKYGAGSGHSYDYMKQQVSMYKSTKRGMHLVAGREF